MNRIAQLPGLPGHGQVHQFHRQGQSTHAEGIVLEVASPASGPWVANFQYGDGGLSGIFSVPASHHVVVVARGQGYLLDMENLTVLVLSTPYPVGEVLAEPALQLLICVGYTEIAACSAEGLNWVTARLASDGIRLAGVVGHEIRGAAWSAAHDGWMDFVVDARTGRHRGGASDE